MASAGPHANHLHLAPDKTTMLAPLHSISGAISDVQPKVSKHRTISYATLCKTASSMSTLITNQFTIL